MLSKNNHRRYSVHEMNLASAEKKAPYIQMELEFMEKNSRRRCSGGNSCNMPILSFQVKMALQQEGFNRKKRGYRDINEIDINMNDPLFTKQWYLVSMSILFLMFHKNKNKKKQKKMHFYFLVILWDVSQHLTS